MSSDTIFALATPPAKSGVAIVRVSGSDSLATLIRLSGKSSWQPNEACYVSVRDASGKLIDKSLAIFFKSPRSFTGEDTAEIHCHGSLAIIRELLETLGAMDGLRMAEAGEFTRRAYLNGKLDLLEAEGLADLIDAETPAQREQAISQMKGEMSHYYDTLRSETVQCLALLEVYIDFPDEDIPPSVLSDLDASIDSLRRRIRTTLADAGRGERLREGISIAIIGAPNVGKSTLMNTITRKNAAITSPIAGTTRDIIEVPMTIAGFPVVLSDTAGIRQASDIIEEEGVRRALGRAQTADLKLIIIDSTQPVLDPELVTQINGNCLIIFNKCDLLDAGKQAHLLSVTDKSVPKNYKHLELSAQSGQGVDLLLSEMENIISSIFSDILSPMITRSRHRILLESALKRLERFSPSTQAIEFACEELRAAAADIGKITGKIQVDDILDAVFRQFCIGK